MCPTKTCPFGWDGGSITLCKYWQLILHVWLLGFGAIVLIISSKNIYHLLFNIAVTEVHGRTFGVWTLLTCTLCYLCAFNLDNKPLYTATFLSFIYAFAHFLSEYLIYHTMAIENLTTVGIFAGTSIIWMSLQWNSHQPAKSKHQ